MACTLLMPLLSIDTYIIHIHTHTHTLCSAPPSRIHTAPALAHRSLLQGMYRPCYSLGHCSNSVFVASFSLYGRWCVVSSLGKLLLTSVDIISIVIESV